MKSKQSRLILVTGVTRGLGRVMTEGFIAAGHTVIGCGRSETQIAELRTRHSAPHRFDSVDVADAKAVSAWAQDVISTHGAPDLLINNAALMNRNAPLWEISAAEFDPVINVNIKGPVNLIRAFVPAMKARGSGVIINISSGWGKSTSPEVAPYCATKWAIEGLTKALSHELPKGMAAIALTPGVIDTDMLRSCSGEGASRHIKPDAWAKIGVPYILELSSEDNGKSLRVPGC